MGISTVEAVFLTLDPAKHTSGATILIPDYGNPMLGEEPHAFRGDYCLHEFGKVTTQSERERFVTSLLDISEELSDEQDKDIPPIVVAEEWDGPRDRRIRLAGGEMGWARDPKWTFQTIMGIGEGWGRWSAEIEVANEVRREEKISPDIILQRVLPNIWRDIVFGENRPKDSENLKAAAIRYFKGVFGYDVGEDIAEAGCIGIYAVQNPEFVTLIEEWRKKMAALMDEVEAEERAAKNKKRQNRSKKKKR